MEHSVSHLILFTILPVLVNLILYLIILFPDRFIASEEKRGLITKYRWIWFMVATVLLLGNGMNLIQYLKSL